MAKSIFAVVTGFLFIAALSFGADAVLKSAIPSAFSPGGQTDSTPVLLLVIAYVFVFAVSGCYVTARLSPKKPLLHAMVLGGCGLIFSIIGTITMWDIAPAWYHIVSLLLVLPAAWLGGQIRLLQVDRQGLASS